MRCLNKTKQDTKGLTILSHSKGGSSRPLTKPRSDSGSDKTPDRTGILAFGAELLFWEKQF